MAGFKTEGVILKRKDFGEADRLLTAFTLHSGKVKILAKGVRRITSRRAGNIELLNRVQMYLHQGKNFLILTEATSIDPYEKLKQDLTLSTYAYHILELTDKLTAEGQADPILYNHLLEVLTRMNIKPRKILVRAYEAKALSHLGFMHFTNNERLRTSVSKETESKLAMLENLSWDEIEQMEIDARQSQEIERVLRFYTEKVLESSLKSMQVLKSLKS